MSESGEIQYDFKPLADKNQLRAFSCGEHDIDKWARKSAWGDHGSFRSRVTTVHDALDDSLVGIYSVLVTLVPERSLTKSDRFPRHPTNNHFVALQLERIAVQRERQGTGIGTITLGRVIATFREAAISMGIPALIVYALNDRAAGLYYRLGFRPYGGSGNRNMLLPAQSVIDLPAP